MSDIEKRADERRAASDLNVLEAQIQEAQSLMDLRKAEALVAVQMARNREQTYVSILSFVGGAAVTLFALWLGEGGENARHVRGIDSAIEQQDRAVWREALLDYSIAKARAAVQNDSGGEPGTVAPTDPAVLRLCGLWRHALLGGEVKEALAAHIAQEELCNFGIGGHVAFEVVPGEDKTAPKRAELRAVCRKSEWVVRSVTARDRSGINGRPRASRPIVLEAPENTFFAGYDVVGEYYRNEITPVRDTITTTMRRIEGEEHVVAYAGSVMCSNSKGTRRTCEATVTLRAQAVPDQCAQFLNPAP